MMMWLLSYRVEAWSGDALPAISDKWRSSSSWGWWGRRHTYRTVRPEGYDVLLLLRRDRYYQWRWRWFPPAWILFRHSSLAPTSSFSFPLASFR
jgi:hypothetical protein